MPFINSQCNLYIGLKDVLPGKVLNFLFQLEEDNYDELEKNIEPFMWHYLHRNNWELIEKEEGKFDFSLIQQLITEARNIQLKIIFLWFGLGFGRNYGGILPTFFRKKTARFELGESNIT